MNAESQPDVCKRPRKASLLRQASNLDDTGQWAAAETCSTDIMQTDPDLAEVYMIRARSRRFQDKLDEARADYEKAIQLNPQRAFAWLGRGAVTNQKASRMAESEEKRLILEQMVYPDYKQATMLSPNDADIGLSLLELEMFLGKYREAICTAGSWWNRAESTRHKMVCAWLAAIALILGGKPERKIVVFRDFLEKSQHTLGQSDWCTEEIRQLVSRLEANPDFDRAKLHKILAIHNLFLSRFTNGYLL
jgi:tetratricopeptide (TPR) repeat protein